MLPDVDSLALFVRAAEMGSLTKAADASHIGLAAASRRIALLEHHFDTPLLERLPQGVTLTQAGLVLLAHAKAMLVRMNQMQAEMGDHAAGRKGVLRILANTSALAGFLPDDIAAFVRRHPDVRPVVEERWSIEIVRAVAGAEADLGIVVGSVETLGLTTVAYRADRLAVVMPSTHPLAAESEVRFEMVLDHDVIGLENDSSMTRLLVQHAIISGKTLQLKVQVRSFEAVCRIVQAGLGIGLLPQHVADVLAAGMGLAVRPLAEPWAERTMLLCFTKERSHSRTLSMLVSHLAGRLVSGIPP